MPTKSIIIENLYLSKNFNDCISKMEPQELRDDLKAEVILIICELSEERIQYMHENNFLIFFAVRVILNTIRSSTNTFHKMYRRGCEELKENYTSIDIRDEVPTEREHVFYENEMQQRIDRECLEDLAMDKVYNMEGYEGVLVNLYLKHGNYRSIQTETNIPYSTTYKTIKSTLKKIKCEVLK